jgi:RimJ/RimL family protein N-acetyltransferase
MIWPPLREALEGRIVRLEPIEPAHHDGLLAASLAPEIWTWIDRRVPERQGAFTAWFEARLQASAETIEWGFATRSLASAELIGSSSYLNVRPEHDGLEIGWTWLHPSAWRTGANLEAKLLMLGNAFERLGCMRVEFKTDARNERSRRALAGLPASFEGTFRKHMRTPVAGVRDSAYYSITDDDWAAVRANLLARLDAHAGATVHA